MTTDARRLALEDLARSGLGPECLEPGTGIRVLSRADALAHDPTLSWWRYASAGLACLLFEYVDLEGRPAGMWRLRRLEGAPSGTLGAQLELERYLQARHSRPGVWLSCAVRWAEVRADTSIPIIISEGEKKAEKLCREGYPAIGLGGVWSTSSRQLRIEVLPELLGIDWSERRVVLLFDSDEKRKTQINVARAAARVGDLVRSQGGEVFRATLPLPGRNAA